MVVLFSLSLLNAQTLDEDALLLEIVAKQSHELHNQDTLWVGDSALVLCDTIWKQYVHPLCLPLMYIPPTLSFRDKDTTLFGNNSVTANARRYITTKYADLYVSVSDSTRLQTLKVGKTKVQRAIIKDVEQDKLDLQRALRDNNSPWRKQMQVSLQITQNYATPNWYQGNTNAFAMLASAKGFANYRGENISWENSVEWRTGVSTVSSDSLRKLNTTDDIFRLNTKFGYQVHPKWYISTVGEFRTNFWRSWQTNKHTLASTFLTPIRFTLGVGIDYKPIKGLSVNISPATYKMVYALNSDQTRIDVTDYGIPEGEDILNEVGSSVRVDWIWKPVREIILETKFYFFTNYQSVETELELDVDFIINRYLSAKVMLYPRYDSTSDKNSSEKSRMQFKEFISVGFSHIFR